MNSRPGPMRSFLSWLHGSHQFLFPTSELRVLLAISFFVEKVVSLVSGGSLMCPHIASIAHRVYIV